MSFHFDLLEAYVQGWMKSNGKNSIFLTWLYSHLINFKIDAPLYITFFQMFGRSPTPSVRPSLLMFRIGHPIAQIISSLMLYGSLAVVLSLWRVSKVDVPESSIASDVRVP